MEYTKDYIEDELRQAQSLLSAGNTDARGEVKFWEAKLAKFNLEFIALQRFKKGLQVKRGDELEFISGIHKEGKTVGLIKEISNNEKELYVLRVLSLSAKTFIASNGMSSYVVKIK